MVFKLVLVLARVMVVATMLVLVLVLVLCILWWPWREAFFSTTMLKCCKEEGDVLYEPLLESEKALKLSSRSIRRAEKRIATLG